MYILMNPETTSLSFTYRILETGSGRKLYYY